jgi:hypothetical protein
MERFTGTELDVAWHQATRRPLDPDEVDEIKALMESHPDLADEPSMADLDAARSHVESVYGEVPAGLNLVELAKLARTAAVLKTIELAETFRENAPNN